MKIKRLVCICGWRSYPYPEDTLFAGCGGELNCPECSKAERNKGIEAYGSVHSVTEELPRLEASLLLYLETCLVDGYGRFEGQRTNQSDMDILRRWNNNEFVSFGRISMKAIQNLRGNPRGQLFTHYVRFSDVAWKVAHELRRERAERILANYEARLSGEMAHGS